MNPHRQIVLDEAITPGAVDYSAIVQKIKYSGTAGLIDGGYRPETASIVQQMRKKAMKTIFISADEVKDRAINAYMVLPFFRLNFYIAITANLEYFFT